MHRTPPTHAPNNTIKHISQLLQVYPYTYKCTNLGATCGAPTEALAEGRRKCRWIEDLVVKGVDAFALATVINGDPRSGRKWLGVRCLPHTIITHMK